MLRVIVAGSRGITDPLIVNPALDQALAGYSVMEFEIVSGMADGPDILGKEWAEDRLVNVVEVPANTERFGGQATDLANGIMADISDAAIVFWDGQSHTSKRLINTAIEKGLVTLTIHSHRAVLQTLGESCVYRLDEIEPLTIPKRYGRIDDYQPLIDAHWQEQPAVIVVPPPKWWPRKE